MGAKHYIPMTDGCRDALIAMCILWLLVAGVIFLRVLGRYRGIGIGGDDILVVVAFVSSQNTDIMTELSSLPR